MLNSFTIKSTINNRIIKRLIEYLAIEREIEFYIQKKVRQNRVTHVITLIIRH